MLRRAFGIVGMLLALAAAVVVVPQRGKADDIDKVLVVNGAKKPVPVTGNIGITGTPNVNVTGLPAVQLAGGTTVGIDGTPNVKVVNSPLPVSLQGNASFSGDVIVVNSPTVHLAPGGTVGVAGTPNVNVTGLPAVQLAGDTIVGARNADALQSMQPGEFQTTIQDGNYEQSTIAFTVPAGKLFVLEDFSGRAFLPFGGKLLDARVVATTQASNLAYAVPTFSGTDEKGNGEWVFGRLARCYGAAGTPVLVSAHRDINSGNAEVLFNISGYLVDLP
jgi:hypothetical protein